MPGNNGQANGFYETFWEDNKISLISSFKSAFDKGKLSYSQRQTVIKLAEKKIKIKDLFRTGDLYLY